MGHERSGWRATKRQRRSSLQRERVDHKCLYRLVKLDLLLQVLLHDPVVVIDTIVVEVVHLSCGRRREKGGGTT